jgi:tetratricopeptide (TPR) repeat protein
MKRFYKFTVCFLMLAGLVALAVSGTGCTAKAKKAYHEKRAEQFYAAGQYDQAAIEYMNVLHNAPGDPQAIGRLGLIYYQQGRVQAAAPYLRKGSELDTNNLELRLKLGFFYAAAGRLGDARNAANFVLDHQPTNAEAPILLAQATDSAKQIAIVRARLQKLAAVTGDRAAIEVALGSLALNEHDFKTAQAAYQRALTLDPKSSQAFAALGTLATLENDLTNAAINFKAAAELAPDRSPIKVLYARFKVGTGDAAEGRRILSEMAKRTPDYIPAIMGLAGIASSEKKYDESQGFVDQVLARDPDDLEALLQDSQLKVARNDVPGATAELERITRTYSQLPSAYYQLAQVYLMGNDIDKATAALGRALELNPDYADAIMSLAQIKIRKQDPTPAILALEKLVQKQPQLPQAQLLLADAYRQRNRLSDALAIYDRLEQAFPQNPQISLLAGSAYVQAKNPAAARREFNRTLQIAPTNTLALEQLINLDLSETNFTAALQQVQSRIQADPTQGGLYVLAAKIFSAEGKPDQSQAALIKATQMDTNSPVAYLLLAQSYADAQKNDQSLQMLAKVLAKDPKNLSAMMLQALIYGKTKEYKKQADVYEAMLVIDPQCSPALNNLACIYSQNLINLDRAYDLAQRTRILLPLDPNVADTLGWINYLRGSYSVALGLLQESAAKLPNDPDIQFHVGMANYMSGNEAAARTALQRALQLNPNFPESGECKTCLAILDLNPQTADAAALAILEKRIAEKSNDLIALGRLAAAYQATGNAGKAISTYEALLKAAPNNLTALLNLAQLYAPKYPAKAYDSARSAYNAAPDSPLAAHIYGRLAYQNGDYKLANTLLQQAVQSQTGDALALFDLAQAVYSLGKISDAQADLNNALSLNLPAAPADEAKQMLYLINLAANPAQAVAATARIQTILKTNPDYVPALMAAGIIDERNANATAAIVAYGKILAHFPDFSPAQRQLAILYSKDPAKLAQAADLATKARAAYPDDALLAKATGIILFQQGDFPRAADSLKSTATVLPEDAEVFYYLGAAQFKLKSNAASKTSLQNALALKLSGPPADSAKQMLAQLK